jgi:hypothetical protein
MKVGFLKTSSKKVTGLGPSWETKAGKPRSVEASSEGFRRRIHV